MSLLFTIAGGLAAATLVITLVVRGVWLLLRRKPRRFWRRALIVNLVLLPVHVFVVTPAVFAGFVSTVIGTRGDERAYLGPRIAADGTWIKQSRDSLKKEAEGRETPDPALVAAARAATVEFPSEDGVRLRAFHVLPQARPPRFSVVLVHGLFRGGLELETPAAMFRELGGDVLMLEMRNQM